MDHRLDWNYFWSTPIMISDWLCTCGLTGVYTGIGIKQRFCPVILYTSHEPRVLDLRHFWYTWEPYYLVVLRLKYSLWGSMCSHSLSFCAIEKNHPLSCKCYLIRTTCTNDTACVPARFHTLMSQNLIYVHECFILIILSHIGCVTFPCYSNMGKKQLFYLVKLHCPSMPLHNTNNDLTTSTNIWYYMGFFIETQLLNYSDFHIDVRFPCFFNSICFCKW